MLGLRAIRHQKNITQQELSARSGVPQSVISDIETGKVNPTIRTVRQLADSLQVSLSEIIEKPNDLSMSKEEAIS